MSKELATEYAQTKIEIKRLEQKLEALQPDVLAYIRASVDAKVPAKCGDLGNFVWYPKKTYTYSDECEALKKSWEDRKAEEQARGTYKDLVEDPILKFNASN